MEVLVCSKDLSFQDQDSSFQGQDSRLQDQDLQIQILRRLETKT